MANEQHVIIQTQRFYLKTVSQSDSSAAFRRWTGDTELMGPMNLPPRVLTDAQVRNYFGSFDNLDRFFFMIVEKASDSPIGFWTVEATIHNTATWNIAVDRDNWGDYVAVETGIPLLDYLFDIRGIKKMVTLTLASNAKVIHRMKMGSWRQEGYLVKELASPSGGDRLDQLRFALLAEEWPAAREKLISIWNSTIKPA